MRKCRIGIAKNISLHQSELMFFMEIISGKSLRKKEKVLPLHPLLSEFVL